MKSLKILCLVLLLSALRVPAWAGRQAEDIIEKINKELSVPYMISEVRMETLDKARPSSRDVTEFTLRLAVYPNGSEKTAVDIRKGRPSYRGSKLILEREGSGESSIRFISRSGRRIRTGSDPESYFQFGLLQVADFRILEHKALWVYSMGTGGAVVAKSRDMRKTVYSRRVIHVAEMPDGSLVRKAVDYYMDGKLLKSVRADITEVSPGVWRPSRLVIESNEKETMLTFKEWRSYYEIPESVFM